MVAEILVLIPLAIQIILLAILYCRRRPTPVRAMTVVAAALVGLSFILALVLGRTPLGLDSVLLGSAVWLALVWSSQRFLMRLPGNRARRNRARQGGGSGGEKAG